jgi:hypothetical protein
MIFTVNKTRVTEGDVVEIKWKCPKAQNVKLTIDNGFRSSSADVEVEGAKKFKINRSNGQTVISLDALIDGKKINRNLFIKVKQPKVKVDDGFDSYKRLDNDRFKNFINSIKSKFKSFQYKFKLFWSSLPPQKKQAYILLMIIFGIMIISSFYPRIIFFGMTALSLYLLWTLMKR